MKKILYTLIILGLLTGFFLFTAPGLDTLKRLPDAHQDASWAPFMYYNIARLHSGMGRFDRAAAIYEEMLNTYDNDYMRKNRYEPFVPNELSNYYIPYALFQCGSCYEKTGDFEYNSYTKQCSEGKQREAATDLEQANADYGKAADLFEEFIDRYHDDHPLYSEANRLHNESQIKLESLP